jgi:hypothetical protein
VVKNIYVKKSKMISEKAPLGNNDAFIIRNALALVSINPPQ